MTDYQAAEQDIRAVRDAVFLVEQKISREDEVDDRDAFCRHVVVYVESENDTKPVATGRLDQERDGKVGRVAVLSDYRRTGIGTLVMQAIVDEAKKLGLQRIWFHAQKSAVDFYLALGYEIASEEFLEAGIVHVKMSKKLD